MTLNCYGYNTETLEPCQNKDFLPGERVMKRYWKNKAFKLKLPVMICMECGWHCLATDEQYREANRIAKKAYNEWLKTKKKTLTEFVV